MATVCVGLIVLSSPFSAFGRSTTLSGSVALQQEYDSNIFQVESNREDQWTTIVSPSLTLTSEGEKDLFTIGANSDLEWDQRRDEREFEHHLSLSGTKEISQYFRVTVGNNYTYTDGSPETDMDPALSLEDRFGRANEYQREQVARLLFPEIDYSDDDYLDVLSQITERYNLASPSVQSEVDRILSNSSSRRRSWENEFSVSAEYEFARDSILTIGYSYHLFDDRENYYDEYDEHAPYINISYRFHPQWLASVFYEYSKADYDDAGEEEVQSTGASLAYDLTLNDQLSASYGYEKTKYDAPGRIEFDEQNVELSWGHNQEFGQHLVLTSTLMGDYIDRDIDFDERGVSGSISLTRTIQRGSLFISGNIAMDERDADDGWDKYQRSGALAGGLTYQIFEDLTGSLNASFEKRYDWDLTNNKSTFDDYGAGAGLSWSFSRWYMLSLNYTYDRLDAKDTLVSGYYEHTVMLQLSAAKELLKW